MFLLDGEAGNHRMRRPERGLGLSLPPYAMSWLSVQLSDDTAITWSRSPKAFTTSGTVMNPGRPLANGGWYRLCLLKDLSQRMLRAKGR